MPDVSDAHDRADGGCGRILHVTERASDRAKPTDFGYSLLSPIDQTNTGRFGLSGTQMPEKRPPDGRRWRPRLAPHHPSRPSGD